MFKWTKQETGRIKHILKLPVVFVITEITNREMGHVATGNRVNNILGKISH
ncbi:hypothetical protein [Candidatus Jordarchaeum sp.]|uniref:hypothetical protein n=1 Tax=Candidatus Jordarchaeum sp. TaxID=2823881 RepID=UPI00404B2D85